LRQYLDFEKPLAEIHELMENVRAKADGNPAAAEKELQRLTKKARQVEGELYGRLTPWQETQVARHPDRPSMLEYVERFVEGFLELHGDRAFRDDPAIVGGVGRIGDHEAVFLGHQKGRTLKTRVIRNFGMAHPEGYRKSLRLMEFAERFDKPVVCFIDTPGAYPGMGAEERGQSEAIARNLFVMARLRTPVICTVIGEGGSGGALAIGVGDRTLMLQYSTYSVISPEGCASILWKSADKAPQAAEAMAITSSRLKDLELIDEVVPEPLGGAHRDVAAVARSLKQVLGEWLEKVGSVDIDRLLEERYQRLMRYGKFNG